MKSLIYPLDVHLFSAVICILVDLVHSLDMSTSENSKMAEERIEQANRAVDIFRHVKETSRQAPSIRISSVGEASKP